MSGHSKWAQIKHKKAATDHKKAQIFSKLAKKISIAARAGADPTSNYRLQSIIEEARSFNMPKDNIERAIKKASDKETSALNEIFIQAMGPGGVAIVIEGITDNKNRTVNEIKHLLSENSFKMVPENSLNWMFDKQWSANNPIEVEATIKEKIDKLFEELDNNDDVEEVHSNLAS